MPTLLLEIGCEELPAGACREAGEQLPVIAERELGLAPDNVFVGPRRLALLFEDVPERTPDEWIKGPPEQLADKAAAGFAKNFEADHLERGLHLVASAVRRDPENPLASLKTTSRADYVFARLEARRAGADDAAIGFLAEGSPH